MNMANYAGNAEGSELAQLEQLEQPTDDGVHNLVESLISRNTKLREWIQNAWTFYNQNQLEGFVLLLERAITHGTKVYAGHKDDLLRMHTMLTAHYIRLACSEHGQSRAAYVEKVTQQLQLMDNLQVASNDIHHLLVRGFGLVLTDQRLQDADNYFIDVLRQMPYNVPALLGRGCLAYNRQEYREALGYFKSVLMHHPHGPADVRVGIAHCFLQLGDLDRARHAFELAVQRNGHSISALLGIAQLKLNERQRASNMEATNLLCTAFELNNRHPVVLSWLVYYLYYSRNYSKLQTAAGNAYVITDDPELKAQNCFFIARSFHATQNFDRAFDFYDKALKCLPDYAPPRLGMAQIYVRRGQLDMAEHSLRSFLKLLPENPHGLHMLATLYVQAGSPPKLDKAIQLFKSAIQRNARDFDTWLSLGGAYERKQLWQEAIAAYEQAVSIFMGLQKSEKDIPKTWLNNIAVLQLHSGQPGEALKTLDNALSSSPTDSNSKYWESDMLTLRFNRARVLEELHLFGQAESGYKELIAEYPNYYDSYIRLGIMAKTRNQLGPAMEYFKAVIKLDSENVAARTFIGNLYANQGALSQAMCNYNAILRRSGTCGDSYMLVAVGNVCLIKVEKAMANGQLEMARQYQESALQLFRRALEHNPRNLWAANGIGVALSNCGHLTDGEAIFKHIVESSKQCTAAILNTAHIAMELKYFTEAIEIYKQCLADFLPTNSVKEMQLLASAYYETGRFKEAELLLLKARHICPYDSNVIYNLAIIIKENIKNSFSAKKADREYLEQAEHALGIAENFFNYLSKKEPSLLFAQKQANKCKKLLEDVAEELKCIRQLEAKKSRVSHKTKKHKRKHSSRKGGHRKGHQHKVEDLEKSELMHSRKRSKKGASSTKRHAKSIDVKDQQQLKSKSKQKEKPQKKTSHKKSSKKLKKVDDSRLKELEKPRKESSKKRNLQKKPSDADVSKKEGSIGKASKKSRAIKPSQSQTNDIEKEAARKPVRNLCKKRDRKKSKKNVRGCAKKGNFRDKQHQMVDAEVKAKPELEESQKGVTKSRKRKHRTKDNNEPRRKRSAHKRSVSKKRAMA